MTQNRPGFISFILAIVSVAFALGQQLVTVFVPTLMAATASGAAQAGVFFGLLAIVHTGLALATLIFGLVGANRPGPHVTSGIGIGIGGAGVLSGVIALLVVPLIAALL
jgi:hypothetical protein